MDYVSRFIISLIKEDHKAAPPPRIAHLSGRAFTPTFKLLPTAVRVGERRPVMAKFSGLSDCLKILNQELNHSKKLLPMFEDKLNRLYPGLLVWVEKSPLHVREWKDEQERKGRTRTIFGFGKHAEKNQLLLKTIEELLEVDDHQKGSEQWKVLYQVDCPLLESSQDDLIAALERLEGLLEVIEIDAAHKIATVKKGRQILEEIITAELDWLPPVEEKAKARPIMEPFVGVSGQAIYNSINSND